MDDTMSNGTAKPPRNPPPVASGKKTVRYKPGDRVRVQRDEKRWPSKGSWPRYRKRLGTVVQSRVDVGEVGVVLGQPVIAERRDGGLSYDGDDVVWFRHDEITHVKGEGQ